QNAGSYSAEFDGSGFSSGIYFYKLDAGEFSETKRMILLK
ncbi:MAG TPA: T9SS type A sorting domain-containing protein, partial [Ignavibacteria bacterium]|nr:T9SS type A sorting domain-containing protein [Ignavibacteria bacterium]